MNGWSSVDTAQVEVLARQLTAAAVNTAQLAVGVGGRGAFQSGSLAGFAVLVPADNWQGPAASAAASATGRVAEGLTALTWALGEAAVALAQLATALSLAQAQARAAERSWSGESVASADQQARAQVLAAQAAEFADMQCAATFADITAAAGPLTRTGVISAPEVRHVAPNRRLPAGDVPPPPEGRGVRAARSQTATPRVAKVPRLLAGSLRSARVVVVVPPARSVGASRAVTAEAGAWQVAHVAGDAGHPAAVLRSDTPPPGSRCAAELDAYLAGALAEVAAALGVVGDGALVVAGLMLLGGAVVALTGSDTSAIAAEIAWADRALAGLLSTAGCWRSLG